jgi:hypothetical protein
MLSIRMLQSTTSLTLHHFPQNSRNQKKLSPLTTSTAFGIKFSLKLDTKGLEGKENKIFSVSISFVLVIKAMK